MKVEVRKDCRQGVVVVEASGPGLSLILVGSNAKAREIEPDLWQVEVEDQEGRVIGSLWAVVEPEVSGVEKTSFLEGCLDLWAFGEKLARKLEAHGKKLAAAEAIAAELGIDLEEVKPASKEAGSDQKGGE